MTVSRHQPGIALSALCVASLLGLGETRATAQTPEREIFQVSGDVYQFRSDNHYGTFVVTPDGVILIDPIAADAATWLKGELATRFPGRPVKVVVYSHHHGDHSGGAEALADTVTEIVAHENAPRGIAADDRVSVMPTRTFTGHTAVSLGGRTIELVELGPGHSDSLVGVRFPQERILLVVDIFSGRRLPFRGLAGSPDVDTIVGTLRRIEGMDFDVLITGHSRPSNVADLVAYRTFLENLRARILQARREGKTVDQMKAEITMAAYRDWLNYEAWLPLSIENMNTYLERIGAR
jgi:glyoxylase-like metal-dependent hydrolase (beta-lactamase superfamily II)